MLVYVCMMFDVIYNYADVSFVVVFLIFTMRCNPFIISALFLLSANALNARTPSSLVIPGTTNLKKVSSLLHMRQLIAILAVVEAHAWQHALYALLKLPCTGGRNVARRVVTWS